MPRTALPVVRVNSCGSPCLAQGLFGVACAFAREPYARRGVHHFEFGLLNSMVLAAESKTAARNCVRGISN